MKGHAKHDKMYINDYLRSVKDISEAPKLWEMEEMIKTFGYPKTLKILHWAK
jgi:hypothetical protein